MPGLFGLHFATCTLLPQELQRIEFDIDVDVVIDSRRAHPDRMS